MPEYPVAAIQRCVPLVIGLLTLQAVVASIHTSCSVVVKVRVNPVLPNCEPERMTLADGVVASEVVYLADIRYWW